MKLLLVIILTLVAAVGLGLMSLDDPGYVVLTRDPYVVRLPLLMFVLLLVVGFLLFYLLFNFIAGIFRAPKKYRKWREQSNQNAAQKHTMQGFAGLIEGNWSNAERSLLKKLDHNSTPLLNFLGAAYAAQQQAHLPKRNRYLDEALAKHPDQFTAITLTRARLHFQAGEMTEARDCLESIRKSSPKNAPAVKLLGEVYESLGDWDSLTQLLPVARRLKLFPEQELIQREQSAYAGLLSSPALLQGESDRPANTWDTLPRAKKSNPVVIESYVKQLVNLGDTKQAETILRRALNKSYSSGLIHLYGTVHSPFVEYQIQLAGAFLKKHGDDPSLLLCLARLHRYNDNFEKSVGLFKDALKAGAAEEAYVDLASLLEHMGQTDTALHFYKKSIEAMTANDNVKGELVVLESDEQNSAAMPVVR